MCLLFPIAIASIEATISPAVYESRWIYYAKATRAPPPPAWIIEEGRGQTYGNRQEVSLRCLHRFMRKTVRRPQRLGALYSERWENPACNIAYDWEISFNRAIHSAPRSWRLHRRRNRPPYGNRHVRPSGEALEFRLLPLIAPIESRPDSGSFTSNAVPYLARCSWNPWTLLAVI